MQIIAKCQDLKKKLDEFDRLNRLKGQAQGLESRRQELRVRRQTLSSPIKSALLLRAKDIVRPDSWPDNTDLRHLSQHMFTLRIKVEESPDSLTQGQAYAMTLKQLDALANSICTTNRQAWEIHVDSRAPAVPMALLDILGRLSKFSNDVRVIKQLNGEIAKIRNQIPLEEADITHFHNLSSSFQETLKKLDLSRLPEEVETFLRAAFSPDGAAILLLSQEVINWLKEHDSLAEFRITSSRQSRSQQFR